MRSEKTQPKKPESRARALENKSCQAALERSMTDRVTDDCTTKARGALADMGSGKSTLLKMLVAKFPEHIPRYFDCTTKARGALADEYEIYEEYTTDPTPLTYDEWLNS
jgi:ATPase subunit of ABC transporter with duplicated ATPase domains